MAQLSRPYQIALAAVATLALVWFVALRGHHSSPSEPLASAPSTPTSAAPPAKAAASAPASKAGSSGSSAGAPSRIYHGPAPGVEGLTRAIAKAHGAVASSERHAAELQRRSAQASGEATSGSRTSSSAHRQTKRASSASPASTKTSRPSASSTRSGSAAGVAGRPALQSSIEGELARGKTVVLVFWNPRSPVDATVRSQAFALGHDSRGRVAVHAARPSQVGLFGPVTEAAHVYQTPTVLIVGRHGLITTLTGLTDTFGLQQVLREAEHVNK